MLSLFMLISFPVAGFSVDDFCESKTAKKYFKLDFEYLKNQKKAKAEARMEKHKELVADLQYTYSGKAQWLKERMFPPEVKKEFIVKMIEDLHYKVRYFDRGSSEGPQNYFVNSITSAAYFPLKLIGGVENYKNLRVYDSVDMRRSGDKFFYKSLSRIKEFSDPDSLLLTIKKNLDHMIEIADKKAKDYSELPASASVLVGDLCEKNTPVEKISSEVQAFCNRYGGSDCNNVNLILEVYADTFAEKTKCEDLNAISGTSRSSVKHIEKMQDSVEKLKNSKQK